MRFEDRVQATINAIRAYNVGLDVSPLSNVRTLVDAVSEMGAQGDLEAAKLFDWDLTKLQGQQVDDFLSIFGFARIGGIHATGWITLRFGLPVRRDYLLTRNDVVYSRRGGIERRYYVETTTPIPQGVSSVNVPIIASEPGPGYNAGVGEVNVIKMAIEQLVAVGNLKPITGGRRAENDIEALLRFRTTIFRNNLGSETYYASAARRHVKVSAAQVIRPAQEIEEHLQIKNGEAKGQEDSIKYVYPKDPGVLLTRTGEWLEEGRDYIFHVNNIDREPPTVIFSGDKWVEGDLVTVRYRYCSTKSRNDPATNTFGYLDVYVRGREPQPVSEYSTWPLENTVGNGVVTTDTHPDAIQGRPYYIFTRQPVVSMPLELIADGILYNVNEDYVLIKDRTESADSTRARDALMWLSALPPGNPTPSFDLHYFRESVVDDIQRAIDVPESHAASDDVLIHGATETLYDFHFLVEWERGIDRTEDFRVALEHFLTRVEMGASLHVGTMLQDLNNVPRVATVLMGDEGISNSTGRWVYNVPLPDGSVPILGNLKIDAIAPNTYTG